MSEREALLIFCDAMDAAVTQLRQNLGAPTKKPEADGKGGKEGFKYDPEKILWEEAKGPSGSYLLATTKANEDNPDFALLKKALEDSGKTVWGKSYFYWLITQGPNAGCIGRKQKAKKQ